MSRTVGLRMLHSIVALAICITAQIVSARSSPPVQLALASPWNAPNLLVEIVESVWAENNTAYFALVENVQGRETFSPELSPEQLYTQALDVITNHGHLTSQRAVDNLKFALAIHASAPRIEAYHQFYTQTVKPRLSTEELNEVWVDVDGEPVWQVGELEDKLRVANKSPLVLAFDHVAESSCDTIRATVVLYTPDFQSLSFVEFHQRLVEAKDRHCVNYIIRYKPGSASEHGLYLTGYGVELALKNMDYLVMDDRTAAEGENRASVLDSLTSFGKKVGQALFQDTSVTIEPLASDEIQELGLKAAQFIATGNNALSALVQLSQDFPKYAHSIAKIKLDTKFVEEVVSNRESVYLPQQNGLWINGNLMDEINVDPFSILRVLQRERDYVETFERLGYSASQAIDIITHPALAKQVSSHSETLSDIYDVRSPIVSWWNDLEKDKRYRQWSSNLYELLQPAFPGQLRAIRRNIYNLVMVENLASLESLERVTRDVRNIIKQNTPIRFGLAPVIAGDDDASTAAAAVCHYIHEKWGSTNRMIFLEKLLELMRKENVRQASPAMVKDAFSSTIKQFKKVDEDPLASSRDIDQVIELNTPYLNNVRTFLKRLGLLNVDSSQGVMFLNGKLIEYGPGRPWTQSLMTDLNIQTQIVARKVYFGEMEESANVYDFLLSMPYVAVSRNPFIQVSESNPLEMIYTGGLESVLPNFQYLQSGEYTALANMWVIADMNTREGLELVHEALSFLESNSETRLLIIHNQDIEDDEKTTQQFSDLLYDVLYHKQRTFKEVQELINLALSGELEGQEAFNKGSVNMLPGSPVVEMAAHELAKGWRLYQSALVDCGLDQDFTGVIFNGRIVGPLLQETVFVADDFHALFQFETQKRVYPVQEALDSVEFKPTEFDVADRIMMTACLIETDRAKSATSSFGRNVPSQARQRPYQALGKEYTRITAGKKEGAFAEFGVVLDPLSETAQKWSSMLETLSGMTGIYVELYLNPAIELQEMPLGRFYRYVLDRELHFDPVTGHVETPTAYFADLPIKPLYTLGVETIKSWHVTVKEANVDLDNIKLDAVADQLSVVHAVYELEYILIEGHCVESGTRSPPRGLQFVLGTPTKAHITDTIVMANLGYFQLKARPGLWKLALREGRSSEVYHIDSVGQGTWDHGSDKADDDDSHLYLALTSFEGLTVFPKVGKNTGMEDQDVLTEREASGKANDGFWSSLSSKLFGSGDGKDQHKEEKPKQAEINIFSVASGKLYERFLSIMIASVMEHTNSTVKFWFIENFLSPSFKDFVPLLAQEYGFDYEMVTYKWPSWLRSQKEKQRTIWGYKILFLDVLFPLDLEKVIFVDADQIVRTDMKELVDMDLHGAPYGYTPFCSDRTEMDGFRFWNHGYWKDHLRGKPYHISALYVVDLVRFRQMAAGDRLRAQYQSLSADPNSLANLDQDLPNNMQNTVPIFSLPQEWLWCETWCSDESLKTAKTIDLCNNPLTKEPKLSRARRQVPEWETYDNQISALQKKFNHRHVSLAENIDSKTTTTATTAQRAQTHIVDEL